MIDMGTVERFGTMGVLNVGSGDTKLSFDPENPAERIRAARIVKDMLRRGYALLIEVERNGVKKFERAIDFREDTCEYIIADFDPVAAAKADQDEADDEQTIPPAGEAGQASGGEAPAPNSRAGRALKGKRKGTKTRIDAAKTRGVAVARSAGG